MLYRECSAMYLAGEEVYPAIYALLTGGATVTVSELEFGAQAAR